MSSSFCRAGASPAVRRMWASGALALQLLIVTGLFAAERQLGTCGPPPRQAPQRQTSSEAIVPLPLPITPMRRSEPKAEPKAPLLLAKLEYGTTQDWNTDPGDADNLMRHARYQVGLWYSAKNMSLNELVALHQAGERSRIPLLYISGHDAFEFTPDQRQALRQYLLDGGTLFGDACCGSEAFTRSFTTETRTLFPDRAFDLLELDHPLFSAYYPYANIHYIEYKGGAKTEFQGPPQLLGMSIGCRTAVILTPWDMSCGWDEHTHEHGARMIPGDAIRLGINLISYVAATRQLGETQAVTREIAAVSDRPRQQMTFAQLRHQGDWNPDPNSVQQLFRQVALHSSLAVEFTLKPVEATESQLAAHPFVYLTGHRDPRLSDAAVDALRRHLQAGGFLFINNCCGRAAFDRAIRALAHRLFPDQPLAALAAEDPLYSAFFTIATARDRQSGAARKAELEGIKFKDRHVLIYSKNDAVTELKQVSDPFGNGYDATSCRELTLNIIAYALQN